MGLSREQLVSLTLRVGLAFAFIYPAIAAIFDPVSWGGYIPSYVRNLVPFLDREVLLHLFGALEGILALWVLSGWNIKIPAALMAGILLAIVILHRSQFDVLFRDVSILALAVALLLLPEKRKSLEAE